MWMSISPPAISPTEGHDLCETDVPSVAIHSVTLLICLCGLAGNGAVLWVLRIRMHKDTMKPITAYILDLALINLLFLIYMVHSTLQFLQEDFSYSSIMSPAYIRFLFLLFPMFHSVGLYRLTAISIERGRSMLCPPGLFCHLPQDLSWVVVSAMLWALSITVITAISVVNSLLIFKNNGIFILALLDFLFLLFAVPSALLILVEDVSCSPVLPLMYMNFVFQLSVLSCYWALYRVTFGNNERYMRNFSKLCCRCDPPLRLLWVLVNIRYWAFFAVFTVIPSVTFLCPSHQQEHCRAAFISVYLIILLFIAAPMLVSSTVDFIRAKWGSQQQQPERHDIVIFVIGLLALILSLWNFLQEFGYITVPSQVVFLLNCIHSSIKPFIYFLWGRCWRPCSIKSLRLSLQRVFEGQKIKTTHKNDATRDTGV
nr:mas-related G-protein coupled receptor member H-like [Zonotrichia albicollis]